MTVIVERDVETVVAYDRSASVFVYGQLCSPPRSIAGRRQVEIAEQFIAPIHAAIVDSDKGWRLEHAYQRLGIRAACGPDDCCGDCRARFETHC